MTPYDKADIQKDVVHFQLKFNPKLNLKFRVSKLEEHSVVVYTRRTKSNYINNLLVFILLSL